MSDTVITNEVHESLSSVEIKHTTKGVTWAVKAYNNDPDIALQKATEIHEKLNIQYNGGATE